MCFVNLRYLDFGVDNFVLYIQFEDILQIYNVFKDILLYFSIVVGFGNVYGVYVFGNVKLYVLFYVKMCIV